MLFVVLCPGTPEGSTGIDFILPLCTDNAIISTVQV